MALKDYFPALRKSSSPAVADRVVPTIRSQDDGVEKKSISLLAAMGDFGISFADYLGGTNGDLRALEAIRLYKNCTPFYQAVSMRAEAFSSIPIRLFDKKAGIFIDNHPVLDLLNRPNPQQSKTAFLKAYSSFYDIAGESFFMVTGDRGREPSEIYIPKPQEVIIQASNRADKLGAAGQFYWYSTYFNEIYYLSETDEAGGMYRYWNRGEDREFAQVKEFEPLSSVNCLRGMPKAAPLWLQIQQFILADTNNRSVLSRGARPSVAWVSKLDEPLTDKQFQRWKEQVQSYEGALNAGRQVLVDNVEPKVISTTNKDMEFSQNRKTVREDIFSAYGIPLSMISAESMTMDNLKVSGLLFWENSVLPLADNLMDELSRILLPRYKNSENLVLSYNPIDIQALKARAISETSELQKTAILTDNELRTRVGYEELDGGDSVWKLAGSVPAESDKFTGDNLQKPDKGSKSRELKAFRDHCKEIIRTDGSRVFSDAEVDTMAREQGLM